MDATFKAHLLQLISEDEKWIHVCMFASIWSMRLQLANNVVSTKRTVDRTWEKYLRERPLKLSLKRGILSKYRVDETQDKGRW